MSIDGVAAFKAIRSFLGWVLGSTPFECAARAEGSSRAPVEVRLAHRCNTHSRAKCRCAMMREHTIAEDASETPTALDAEAQDRQRRRRRGADTRARCRITTRGASHHALDVGAEMGDCIAALRAREDRRWSRALRRCAPSDRARRRRGVSAHHSPSRNSDRDRVNRRQSSEWWEVAAC
jgi:hypothetical protein